MKWNPAQLLTDFLVVAELGEIKMQPDAIRIETLSDATQSSTQLAERKNGGIRFFPIKNAVLKVGKAGPSISVSVYESALQCRLGTEHFSSINSER